MTRKLLWPAVLGLALQTCALSAAEWPLPPLGGESGTAPVRTLIKRRLFRSVGRVLP
jgi:hypothetical protein